MSNPAEIDATAFKSAAKKKKFDPEKLVNFDYLLYDLQFDLPFRIPRYICIPVHVEDGRPIWEHAPGAGRHLLCFSYWIQAISISCEDQCRLPGA